MANHKHTLKEAKVGDVSYSKGTKSTITNIDPETGRIEWKVEETPDFTSVFKNLKKAKDFMDSLAKNKDIRSDETLKKVQQELTKIFNILRTHVRKNYPEEYARIKMVAETSTTGGGSSAASFTPGTGAQYATPFAFNKNKKAKGTNKDILTKKFGYKLATEGQGATLGPGPSASEKGVKDNYYVKAFGYKLVPNKIKNSGLEVKNLFEAETSDTFQKRRIAAFDEIEKQLNDVYKMLSNAKNETVQYYTDNPSSYAVVKPTDLVMDYINDIKDLLGNEG